MPAVLLRARSQLARRRQGWLGLALLIGVVGGVVIALAAGARRTDSAFLRLVERELPLTVSVVDGGFDGAADTPPGFLDAVARLPQVAEAHQVAGLVALRAETEDGRVIIDPDYIQTIMPVEREGARAVARQKLVEGRHSDPDDPDEVVIGFSVADRYDIEVGETLTLLSLPLRELGEIDESTDGDPLTFEVVGVTAAASEFPPRTLGDGAGTAFLTPAAAVEHEGYLAGRGIGVRLHDEARDRAAFEREVERLAGGVPFEALGVFGSQSRARTQDAIHLLAQALWLLAGLAAVTGTLVGAQALARQSFLAADDDDTLRALGMTDGDLAGVAAVRGAAIGVGAAVTAVVVAAALSPLFPLGLARMAEPDTGPRLDAAALGLGGLAVALAVLALAALFGWRAARPATGVTEPRRPVATKLATLALPASVSAGLRLALVPGHGRTAVPVRTTVAGAAVGVLALVAALTFTASLDRLVDNPSLYGWNWDVTVGDGYSPNGNDLHDAVVPALEELDEVDELATGTLAILEVEGERAMGMALDPVRGSIEPTLVAGRSPQGPDEVLLGRRTMEDLDVGIGDRVDVRLRATFQGGPPVDPTDAQPYRVVGRGVLPEQSGEGLDRGVAMTYRGISRLVGTPPPRNFFPVRYAAGVDPDAAYARLTEAVPHYLVPTQRPTDLVNFGRVDSFPAVAGGLMAAVAAAMLGHALVTSIRRRRRELAVLKTLGFERRQVAWTVAWQASVLTVLAAVLGLPVGVVVGRWLWTVVAERLGVVPDPAVPVLALALLLPAALVVANLVAAAPARAAGRTRPAPILRAE